MTGQLQAKVHVLRTPAGLRELLMSACPPGPSLHPEANSDDPWRRWNGWNQVHLVGVDADNVPFQAHVTAYASGHHDLTMGRIGEIPHGGLKDDDVERRTGLRFPLQAFPPLPVVLHPEHTP